MNFHFEVLPEDSKRIIPLLKKLSFIKQFYLAGGTAAALYLGHRLSRDFDFFTPEQFNESFLVAKISELGKFQLEKKSEQTVIGIFNNTKISFLGYNYPLLYSLENTGDVDIAGIADIACMKIDAISNRGTKRDFIDVYFIAKDIMPLPEILSFFEKKYESINYNMMHIQKSLVYFKDAEDEPMPQMLKPVNWETVKLFFEGEIRRF